MAAELPDDTIVCRCEAVTAGDIRAVGRPLGAREINRAKAFSRLGMGRCQGRFCGPGGSEVLAGALDRDLESIGRLRGAGPVKPLKLASALDE